MAAGKASRPFWLLPISLLAACGSGEIGQTVFTVEAFCTLSPRLAVVVEIYPGDREIVAVSAKNTSLEHCYLERSAFLDDAGEPEAALYSCLFQGHGTYEVRVESGTDSWTQSVDISGDQCRVTALQKLTFEL